MYWVDPCCQVSPLSGAVMVIVGAVIVKDLSLVSVYAGLLVLVTLTR